MINEDAQVKEDEKYPSLNCSEPLSFRRVACHRVEDVHQHQEQGHQQGHSTWNCHIILLMQIYFLFLI